jgi:hypothetical protein
VVTMKYTAHILLCLLLYISASQSSQSVESQPKQMWVTIFVHGIISIKPYLSLSNVVKFIQDKIAHTTYARTIELTRKDRFFYQHHPMQELGLLPINMHDTHQGAAACAFAQTFDHMFDYTQQPVTNRYYTFGWSGLLSPRMRYLESKILYDQILATFGHELNGEKRLKLRIVGYSHGGNVALQLAEVYKTEQYTKNKKLTIDELVLIGLPVVSDTDYLVQSSLFKKIYHFYSYGDRVQRMDCFSLTRVLSNRVFKERANFKLPEKLVQINVRIRRPIDQVQIPSTVDQQLYMLRNHRLTRTVDPGHTELWSFGWTPSNYRKNFPLNPLPFAVVTPFIIAHLDSKPYRSLTIEVNPAFEKMIVHDDRTNNETIMPFLTHAQLEATKQTALAYKPDRFTKSMYQDHIKHAKTLAKKQWVQEGGNI